VRSAAKAGPGGRARRVRPRSEPERRAAAGHRSLRDAGPRARLAKSMAPPAGELWCGGFHVGHPAATDSGLDEDERLQPVLAGLRAARRLWSSSTFVDLEGARPAARVCRP